MNKKTSLYFILLILLIISTSCKKGEAISNETLLVKDYNDIDPDMINSYEIDVKFDYNNHSYTGEQRTTYVNNTNVDLEQIYFHIYPNAFKTADTAPILFSQQSQIPKTYSEGFIDIKQVSINSVDVEYEIDDDLPTILRLNLNKVLAKGDKVTVSFKYIVKLPSAKDRFGYGDRVINVGNWYPIACVYDHNGWNLDPYYKLGDPFYSDIANYKVTINTDSDIVVASSGNILKEQVMKTNKIYHIEGKLIRDFAWAASPDFKIAERTVDGTIIKLYYLREDSTMIDKSLKNGEDSLNTFGRIFGKYPYGQYSIVITEFPSGMEYPGLVFVGDDFFTQGQSNILEQIIVHETAHQWWYGLVGSDQIDEAWLDEALATYSEVIYKGEVHGKKDGEDYFIQNIKMGYEFGEKYLGKGQIVKKPLNEFTSWDDYGILVYTKGAMFINQISEDYGEDVLYEILNTYFRKYKFYNATTEDFISVCEEITKDDFTELVTKWLY